MNSSMALCPHCKKPMSGYATTCTHCGARLMLSALEVTAQAENARKQSDKNQPTASLLARLLKRIGRDKL